MTRLQQVWLLLLLTITSPCLLAGPAAAGTTPNSDALGPKESPVVAAAAAPAAVAVGGALANTTSTVAEAPALGALPENILGPAIASGTTAAAPAPLSSGNQTDAGLITWNSTNPIVQIRTGNISDALQAAADAANVSLPIPATGAFPETKLGTVMLNSTNATNGSTPNGNWTNVGGVALPGPQDGVGAANETQGPANTSQPAPPPPPDTLTGVNGTMTGNATFPDPQPGPEGDLLHGGQTLVVSDGSPSSMLHWGCRQALAAMFSDDTGACGAENLLGICTTVIYFLQEWQLLCISQVFQGREAELFQPDNPGALRVNWGTPTPYLGLLGTVAGALNKTTLNADQSDVFTRVKSTVTLGPVLQALVPQESMLVKGLLLTWTMVISEIPNPLPQELMTRLVLGGVALEMMNTKFSLDNAFQNSSQGGNATTSDPGRSMMTAKARRRQLQSGGGSGTFVRLSYPPNGISYYGQGFNRDFLPVASVGWYIEGSLPNLVFSEVESGEPIRMASCSSDSISETLSLAGSGGYVGGGLDVEGSASFLNQHIGQTSSCFAILQKRVYEAGTELERLDASLFPKLNDAAKNILSTGGWPAFESMFGAYFVLSFTNMAQFDGVCSAYNTTSASKVSVQASFSAKFDAFSANMSAQWEQARSSGSFSYECWTTQSGVCPQGQTQQPLDRLPSCADAITESTMRTQMYELILMRYADLPDFIANFGKSVNVPTQTPFSAIGATLQQRMSTAWTKANYLFSVTASQLIDDDDRKRLQTDLQRIMDVVSAVAAGREIGNDSVATFYNTCSWWWTPANYMLQTSLPAQSFWVTLNGGTNFTDNAMSAVTVGPGLLLEIFDTPGGNSILVAGNVTCFSNLMDSFDKLASQVTMIATSALNDDLRDNVISRIEEQLAQMELRTTFISGCYSTSTAPAYKYSVENLGQHDVRCGVNEMMQGFQVAATDTTIQYNYTCCTLAPLLRDSYQLNYYNTLSTTLVSQDVRMLEQHNINCFGAQGGGIGRFKFNPEYTSDRLWGNCVSWYDANTVEHDDWCRNDFGQWGDGGAACSSWYQVLNAGDPTGCFWGQRGRCRYNSCAQFWFSCPQPRVAWADYNRNCRNVETAPAATGGGNLGYLALHNVTCNSEEVLTWFTMADAGYGNQVKYTYACCGLPQFP